MLMLVNADLHIHSRFSSATSPRMTISTLATEAARKGIHLLATGDCLHPRWQKEIAGSTSQENGVHVLGQTSFVLSTEVEDRRRVHHLLLFPSLDSARGFAQRLAPHSTTLERDGRPKVKLSGAEIAQAADEVNALIGPAHAFTPWTALYAYHRSLQECYQGAPIHFLELGLSADSSYADRIAELQEVTLLSNSDCHSPSPIRLAREFNRLEVQDICWDEIRKALLRRGGRRVVLNVGFPPAEGKYNRTACTSCYRQYEMSEAVASNWRCGCGGRIKKGVKDRVEEVADYPAPRHPPHRPPYRHLLPLAEVMGCALHASPGSATVQRQWKDLMAHFDSEIAVLVDVPLEEIAQRVAPAVVRAIAAFRQGAIRVNPGGGGKYGEIDIQEDVAEPSLDHTPQRRLMEWVP